MKVVQSSSRGRGGGSNYRGRGRGGRGGVRDNRFAARFSDPRFQVSKSANRNHRHHNPREAMEDAARQDPRFAKHFQEEEKAEENAVSDETEQELTDDNVDAERSSNESDRQSEGEEEAEVEIDDEVAAWAPDDVEYTEARHRVAVVNCDWDHIRAVDLYAILFHALPLGGQLHEVSVYMSDFGKKMIEHEKTNGPDLWVTEGDVATSGSGEDKELDLPRVEELSDGNDEGNADEDTASDVQSDGWADDNPSMLTEQGEDGELFSSGKYRRYEMNRMKYYYAVATFDSPDTAAAVYNELDGMDIEASGVVLDLRYIDDDETFDKPVSRANRIPANFKPLSSFRMAALSQSRFRISWDQDDVFRHHSVQDSFTGTTEEDDLAAYLAPPDSDDDEEGDDSHDTADKHQRSEKKRNEKHRVRRKYAALLEEVGGLVEDVEDSEPEQQSAANRGSGSDDGSTDSDDDSLNRFSDVELGSEEEENGGMDDDEGDVMGDLEATLDLDADSKAAVIQREARLQQKMKGVNIATAAELKYKMRRKELKKTKKEMRKQEKEAAKSTQASRHEESRNQLKQLLGSDDNGATHLSGKERRKQHAKQVKERLAVERVAKKKMRAASQLGVTREAQQSRVEHEAEHAVGQLDDRFKTKLLSDPRFHLEVAQKDKRVAEDVATLARTISKARQGKRVREMTTKGTSANSGAAQRGTDVDDAVNFFLSKKAKRT